MPAGDNLCKKRKMNIFQKITLQPTSLFYDKTKNYNDTYYTKKNINISLSSYVVSSI